MIGSTRRITVAMALLAGASAIGGCTKTTAHQGYVIDKALLASVAPGVDNRASVERTLGRPSFAGEFDPDRTWYYVSRGTRQFAFGTPKPISQTVLIVHFDPAGNVTAVDKTGLEEVAKIDPVREITPTLGRKRGFFRDLFSNVGAGATDASSAPTTDNPNGGGGGGGQ